MKYMRKSLMLAAAITFTGALATPTMANAAEPVDYNSGVCHIDVSLKSHKIVASSLKGYSLSGTLSNPNNCPFDFSKSDYGDLQLTPDDSNPPGYGILNGKLNADGTVDFKFVNNSDFANPALGLLDLIPRYISYQYGDDGYGGTNTGRVVIDNAASQQVSVRYKGTTTLSAKRSGSSVTLHAVSRNFDYSGGLKGGNHPYSRGEKVTFQKQVAYTVHYTAVVHGKVKHLTKIKYRWVNLKTVQGSTDYDDGNTHLRVKAAHAIKFRAVTKDSWDFWGSTSKAVVK